MPVSEPAHQKRRGRCANFETERLGKANNFPVITLSFSNVTNGAVLQTLQLQRCID